MISLYLRLFFFLCAASLLFIYPADGSEKSPLTPEDVWGVKRVGSPDVSPDGKTIAFTVTEYNIEENKGNTNIHILRQGESDPVIFTRHPSSDTSPVWSPDGKEIAFLSRRNGDSTQLFIIPAGGGEARQVTDLPVSVSSPMWFAGGDRIAFTASVYPGYGGDFESLKERIKEEKEKKVSAKATENRIYRYWDRWLTDGLYPRLFSVNVRTGEVTDLMPGSSVYFPLGGGIPYDISPDGNQIAVTINSTPPPYERMRYDIYLLSADGSGDMVNITEHNRADDTGPKYSPDGRYILYGKQRSTDFYADNVRLVLYDRHTGERSVLTEEADLSFQQWRWSADGTEVYAHAEYHAGKSIYSVSVNNGTVTEILRGGTNDAVRVAGDGKLVFLHQTLSSPREIYRINSDGSDFTQLTFINKPLLDNIDFGRVEDVMFKGADGMDVQMYIVFPPGFDPAKKYPLVQMIHGGPHGIFGDSFHFRWNAHLFAAPGYVVALPNFHGSTSFGQEFAVSIHGSHADKPFRDIMKATDYLIEQGYIDETRMAAAGGSYGGYMVSWIAGQTDRFAALVNHAGVYNIMGQFASDITYHRTAAYGGSPWDGLERMQKWNPALNADNFSTPMLIIHGERDYRVPVTQGLEVYGVYKGKGLDARLVYYPDENHWILSPQNSIYWYSELYNWLDRYLGNQP